MATNPMQKKARNSFILGILITFVIMAIIVAVLLLQIKKMQEAENEIETPTLFDFLDVMP